MITHASLFTGIGGFDLASRWRGYKNVFQCEKDEFCQKVLKRRFPECELYEDIRQFDARKYEGQISILTGGFPCQPFSWAGKRAGTKDDRYLWTEMLRIIREVKPKIVIGENVLGIISLALGEVLASLESESYAAETFIIPACAVNAPHRRDRIWIVAYACPMGDNARPKVTADAARVRSKSLAHKTTTEQHTGNNNTRFVQFQDKWHFTKSGVCGRNDGVSDRVDRVAALGNAIVPQMAYEIFGLIENTFACSRGIE